MILQKNNNSSVYRDGAVVGEAINSLYYTLIEIKGGGGGGGGVYFMTSHQPPLERPL